MRLRYTDPYQFEENRQVTTQIDGNQYVVWLDNNGIAHVGPEYGTDFDMDKDGNIVMGEDGKPKVKTNPETGETIYYEGYDPSSSSTNQQSPSIKSRNDATIEANEKIRKLREELVNPKTKKDWLGTIIPALETRKYINN